MIRPVIYVDLPGIIYAINHRAQNKQHEIGELCVLSGTGGKCLTTTIDFTQHSSTQRDRPYLDLRRPLETAGLRAGTRAASPYHLGAIFSGINATTESFK